MSQEFYPVLIFEFIILFVGCLYAFMPYLTRKTECFGVTIPTSAQDDSQVSALKRSFRNIMLIITLVFAILAFLVLTRFDVNDDALGGSLIAGTIVLLLAVDFLLYLKFHYAVKRIKAEHGWGEQASQVAVVSISGRSDVVSAWWLVLYPLAIAATAIIGFANYDAMPDFIPMQYDFAGNVTSTMAKSVGGLFFAPGVQLFVALVLAVSYVAIAKSRRQIDASDPEVSLEQSRRFTMAWSAFIVGMGLLLMLMFLFMQLNFIGWIPASAIGYITGIPLAIILIAAIVMSFKYGQGGSRVRLKKATKTTIIDRDDDKYWKLGQFYYNPDDPAVFVEKRFGIGFTNNFARPLTWVFLGGLAVFIIVSIAMSSKLGK